jgi:hypothetical protein
MMSGAEKLELGVKLKLGVRDGGVKSNGLAEVVRSLFGDPLGVQRMVSTMR